MNCQLCGKPIDAIPCKIYMENYPIDYNPYIHEYSSWYSNHTICRDCFEEINKTLNRLKYKK